MYYPQFFQDRDRADRDQTFRDACRLATKLVCISDFVRTTVLQNSSLDPASVVTIHIGLRSRLREPGSESQEKVLSRYNLTSGEYLLYPANFWPHKNHAMLLTAFGMYRARNPASKLKLVCPGALEVGAEYFRDSSRRMALGDSVVFSGYLPDSEFSTLLHASRALIFPSLFEGFGIPVLEAMAAGKPVLCSNLASLPEVAGDAALYFDPKKPDEIMSAIERLMSDRQLVGNLILRGRSRCAAFPSVDSMAKHYLGIFREVMRVPSDYRDGVRGVFSDRWTGQRVIVCLGANRHSRLLEVQLSGAAWWPSDHVIATVVNKSGSEHYVLRRGETLTLRELIPTTGSVVELLFDRVFQPSHCGMHGDDRRLGPRLEACRIISREAEEELL